MKYKIGILAYGSLIEEPGIELEPLIIDRIRNVKTPFSVEFARKSKTRDFAPTLTIVEGGGSQVNGVIFILNSKIDIDEAQDLLWRRETRNENTDGHYSLTAEPNPNKVSIEVIKRFENVETVLYTKIGRNIHNLTPESLAQLATDSAKGEAGRYRKDGISYLMSAKRQGIITPLMKPYEDKILELTMTDTLENAFLTVRSDSV